MRREEGVVGERRSTRTILARTGVALVSACVALFVVNWAVARWCAIPSLIFALDPVLLHKLVPGSRRVLVMREAAGGERVTVEINSHGLRGGELGARGGRPRWFVYGDSLVLAENVREETTFVRVLARELESRTSTAVETVNAGVTGYGPDQVALRIEAEAREGEVDGIVLVLCAHNDLGDLVRDKIFGLDERGELVRREVTLARALVADFAEKERLARKPAVWRWIRSLGDDRSRVESAASSSAADAALAAPPFMQWYLEAARDEYTECVVEKDLRVRSLFEDYYDADVALDPGSDSAQHKRRLLRGVLARIRATAAERGIRLFAVVVPSAVDLCETFDIQVDRARYPAYAPSALTDVFASALRESEIAFVDLFELFARSDACTLFMGGEDFHWNAAGQELAARATAEALVAERWTDRAPPK